MDVTRSEQGAAAKMAQTVQPGQSDMRTDLRHLNPALPEGLATATAPGEAPRKSTGYGMPCAKCHLYYRADIDSCPTCRSKERVSPNVIPAAPKPQAAEAEAAPDTAVVEQEREAFLKEFKSQLFAAHAEVINAPVICTLGEHHVEGEEAASVCKSCYERLQERLDICEAVLHIEVKDAAQIVYDAVWADPSDPSKTYTNAAGALLSELRKRAGVSNMIGPFQPLGN